MNSTRLLAQDVTVKLQLPARRARIRVDDYLEPNWRNRIRGLEEESVDVAIAQSRSSHYHWLFNSAIEPAVEYDAANQKVLYHPERADSDRLRQAIKQKLYWSREAVRLSKSGSRQQRGMRQHLINAMRDSARWLARIGDQGEALALLKQALALCRKHPEVGGYMRGQIEKQIAGLAKT